MFIGMGLKQLYLDIYEHFLDKRATAQGYDFQKGDLGSVAPKQVTFSEKLKWWTLNRPTRMQQIEQERDRRQQEILALKHPSSPSITNKSSS